MKGLTEVKRALLLEACKLHAEGANREITPEEALVCDQLCGEGRMSFDGSWEITPAGREALRIDTAIRVTLTSY